MRIEDIDKNFKPKSLPEGVELEYFDVRETPFKVWGLMYEDPARAFCGRPSYLPHEFPIRCHQRKNAQRGALFALHRLRLCRL